MKHYVQRQDVWQHCIYGRLMALYISLNLIETEKTVKYVFYTYAVTCPHVPSFVVRYIFEKGYRPSRR